MKWRGALIIAGTVLTGGIAVCTALIAPTLRPDSQDLQWDLSPDGNVIAEVVGDLQASTTATDYVSVDLMRPGKFWLVERPVFGGDDYGGRVSVRWLDAHNLLITCSGCKMGPNGEMGLTAIQIEILEQQWQDISIRYEFKD